MKKIFIIFILFYGSNAFAEEFFDCSLNLKPDPQYRIGQYIFPSEMVELSNQKALDAVREDDSMRAQYKPNPCTNEGKDQDS